MRYYIHSNLRDEAITLDNTKNLTLYQLITFDSVESANQYILNQFIIFNTSESGNRFISITDLWEVLPVSDIEFGYEDIHAEDLTKEDIDFNKTTLDLLFKQYNRFYIYISFVNRVMALASEDITICKLLTFPTRELAQDFINKRFVGMEDELTVFQVTGIPKGFEYIDIHIEDLPYDNDEFVNGIREKLIKHYKNLEENNEQ